MTSVFTPRTFVNGGLLRQFNNKNVSIILRVEDEAGTNLNATSTDGHKVRVNLTEPLGARKGSWVEIIGTPTGADALRAKEAILFGGENVDFDEDAYNMLVLFMNNCKEIYRTG